MDMLNTSEKCEIQSNNYFTENQCNEEILNLKQ